jgi:hypothetical protein
LEPAAGDGFQEPDDRGILRLGVPCCG